MDEQVIRRRQFLGVEGQRDFEFARRYGQSQAAASHEHVNPVLAVLPDRQTDPYEADKSKAMLVETYPADEFPPEPVIILVADEWGVFDWLIRSREAGAEAAVVDWNKDLEAFMDDCLKLFEGVARSEHGVIPRYRSCMRR